MPVDTQHQGTRAHGLSPDGKPPGVRCVQLTDDNRCRIFGQPDRPEVCSRLRPSEEMCGDSMHHALIYLSELERLTAPTR